MCNDNKRLFQMIWNAVNQNLGLALALVVRQSRITGFALDIV